MRRPVLIVIAMVLLASGCGVADNGQSVGATTPTTLKSARASTATTTTPILVPGTAGSVTVSPTSVSIGQRLTISGKGCTTNQVQIAIGGGLLTNIRPDAQGSWTTTFTVGDAGEVGDVKVEAICITRKGYAAHYATAVLHISTYRHLDVDPTTAHAGDTLNVTAVGSCNIGPSVMFLELAGPDGVPLTNQQGQPLSESADGVWSGAFVVPSIAAPGPYLIAADCQGRGASYGFMPAPITVLATNEPLPTTAPTSTPQIPITW